MKKALLLLFFIAVSGSVFSQTGQKTGWVNLQSILAQYPLAIKAQSDLDAFVAKKQRQLDSMNVELQTEFANYQKQAQTMTPDARKAKEQELGMKQKNLTDAQQRMFGQPNGEVYVKNDELFAPIKEKIFAVIENIAKEQGMNYVFDRSTEAVVLYADSDFDLTFKVLDRLKSKKQ